MEPTYSSSENKIVITEAKVTEITIEELLQRKDDITKLIKDTKANAKTQVAVYQENLDSVNALIAKATDMGVQPLPTDCVDCSK